MVLALGLGTVGAQSQGAAPVAAPTAADSGAKGGAGAPAAKVGKKRELTAEQKTFEQSIKAMRAQSDQMNRRFVKAERKREKARRQEEKAGRTPSSVAPKNPGNGGTSQGDYGGNGEKGK